MEENKPLFSQDEINQELSSNYTGNEDDLYVPYTGEGDLYLDYVGDAKSIEDMKKSTRRFNWSIENTSDSQKVIVISSASFYTARHALVYMDGTLKYKHPVGGGVLAAPTGATANDILEFMSGIDGIVAAGHTIDAVLDDGIIYAEAADPTKLIRVTALDKNGSVRHFRKYIENNPTYFLGMYVSSTNNEAYSVEMVTRKINPYGVYSEDRINLYDYFTPLAQNTGKIEVPDRFQIDSETLAYITIPANTKVTFGFIAGVVESSSNALKNKVLNAATGVKVVSPKPREKTSAKPPVKLPIKQPVRR